MKSRTLNTFAAVAVLLLPLSMVAGAIGSDWSDVSKRVGASVVYVEGGGGCTGFVIDTVRKYVLSAAHCDVDSDTGRLWVDRVAGRVVSRDSKKDLLVIEVKDLDPSRPALPLAADDPSIQQDVLSAGFGYSLERPFFRRASIADDKVNIPEGDVGGPYIGIDAAFIGGMSGGPVVNAKGEVVMIVQRASDRMGIGVGAAILRERVGRFWGTATPTK